MSNKLHMIPLRGSIMHSVLAWERHKTRLSAMAARLSWLRSSRLRSGSLLRKPRCVMLILASLITVIMSLLSACATTPPTNIGNMCDMFEEKRSWYRAAKAAEKKWGVPVYVSMAFIHQESRFKSKARPPRNKLLWIFPGPRASNAYGYAQALTGTWQDYQKEAGGRFADRDNFHDAIDFVGWYNYKSYQRNGIKRSDAYSLYLAYHEGHTGFRRKTYQNKQWLQRVSRKVESQARRYQKQYWGCHEELAKSWLDRFFVNQSTS